MIKTIGLTILLSGSLFASTTAGCGGVTTSSGCGQWWNSYTIGTTVDGSWNQSTSVETAYTANYTNISASQDPVNSTFTWMNSGVESSSTSYANAPWSLLANSGGSYSSAPSTSSTSNNAYSNNIASTLPTNTGGSTTSSLYTNSTSSSDPYAAYLAMIYGIAYQQPRSFTQSPIGGAADPIVPEPSSIVSMGIGLAMIAAYARRRMRARSK
jgi:hypothetical protein